jgi:hypothetical protein
MKPDATESAGKLRQLANRLMCCTIGEAHYCWAVREMCCGTARGGRFERAHALAMETW